MFVILLLILTIFSTCVLNSGEPTIMLLKEELDCYPGYSGHSALTLRNSLRRCGDRKLRAGGREFCLDSCVFHDQKVAVLLRAHNRTVLRRKNLMRVLRLQFQHPGGSHSIPLLYRAFIECHQKYLLTPDVPCLETKPFWTCLKEKWRENRPRRKIHFRGHRVTRSVTFLEDTGSSRKTRTPSSNITPQYTYTEGATFSGGSVCCDPDKMEPRPNTAGQEYHVSFKSDHNAKHYRCWWKPGPSLSAGDQTPECPSGARIRSGTNGGGPSPHQYSRLPHDLPPKMLAALLRLDPSLAINSSYPLPPLSGHSY